MSKVHAKRKMSPLVKICGLQSLEPAQCAIDNGANMLGVIMVPNRARTVDYEIARKISHLAKKKRLENQSQFADSKDLLKEVKTKSENWFDEAKKLIQKNGPFLVGVFRNQPLETIIEMVNRLELDFVQLHGSEDFEFFTASIPVPVIPRYTLEKSTQSQATNQHILPLLDSETGGEGKTIDWDQCAELGNKSGKYLLAGGLTPENVASAAGLPGCIGVDVSGGVETDGVKDLRKIEMFIKNALA